MADKKISALTALTTAAGTDVFVVVDNSGTATSKKITAANLTSSIVTLGGLATAASIATATSAITFDNLSDVTLTSVTSGQGLKYDGTAWVNTAAYAPLASPTLTGTPLAPTASAATNNTQIATTAYVTTAVAAVSVDFSSDQNVLANAVFS